MDVSRAFRSGLRQELPRWREDGIVDERASAAIAARYRLDEAEAGPSLLAVYVLGAFLVGGGVLSLVAWHWDDMPRALRLAIIGVALVASHGAGWFLWKGRGTHPRLGHALTVLGTLVYGAGIGLVAQMFHVSGPWYGAFGLLALGALVAGALLGSVPQLALAAVVALFVWGPGHAVDHPELGIAAAYALGGGLALLAVRTGSRLVFLAAVAGTGVTLAFALQDEVSFHPLVASAALLVAFPLAATGAAAERLAPAARVAGRVLFYGVVLFASFSDAANELRLDQRPPAIFFVALLPLAALLAVCLLRGLRRTDVDPLLRGEAMLAAAAVPALLAGLSLQNGTGTGAAIVANLALAFLALGRIARGLAWRARAPFWEGIVLAAVLVACRFFEIEHLLWLKGLAFIACGVAVVTAGVLFERKLAAKGEVTHAA